MKIQEPEAKMRIKLKKDDTVIVVRGKRSDRGKTGKILRLIPDKQRVVVEKIHVIKEYIRANPQKNIQGGIVDREGPIPVSSVMYYCKECEQGVRIGYKSTGTDESGDKGKGVTSKKRICKKCGVVLD